MPPSLEDITKGLTALKSHKDYAGKQTQMHQAAFDTLVGKLNVWLEDKGSDTVASENDKKNVARVIWHDPQMKSWLMPTGGKIGPYVTGTLSPIVGAVAAGPKYSDLKTVHRANECSTVRADVARVLGIVDKTHTQHGANFSSPQTLKQIIQNVCAKVQGPVETQRVDALLKKHYPGYS